MTYPPATDAALREAKGSYARAGIAPDPQAGAAKAASTSTQVFSPLVRLVAVLIACACMLGVAFTNPWTLGALVPVGLVLGVGLAQAIFDVAQARAARAAALPTAAE